MTKAEAANILSNNIIDGHVDGNARFMDAFWFAVDNLKAEPCDAVSRADILQKYDKYCENNCQYSKKQRDVMCGACFMGDAIEMVEDAPSVNPARPKGEWIRRSIQSADCSVCGHIQTVHGQDLTGKCHIHKALFKFCPNCGAEMR